MNITKVAKVLYNNDPIHIFVDSHIMIPLEIVFCNSSDPWAMTHHVEPTPSLGFDLIS